MSKKVVFSTQTVDRLPVEFIGMHLSHQEGKLSKITLDISMSYETYLTVKKNGYFHLTFHVMPERTNFDPGKDILITLKADPALVQALAELQNDDRVGDAITVDDEAGELVRNEINWYVLRAAQEIELPAGMKEEGTVVEGFETAYAIEEDNETEPAGIEEDIADYIDEFEDIENVLKKYDIPYIRNEKEFSGEIHYKGHMWTFFIYETDRVFVMCSAYAFYVSQNNYDKACREIVKVNSELTVGSFDLDMEEGVLIFRTYLDTGDEILIPELFERMLIGNIATAGKYYAQIHDAVQ